MKDSWRILFFGIEGLEYEGLYNCKGNYKIFGFFL